MESEEDIQYHWNNPRKFNKAPVEPLNYFKDKLPPVGRVVWLFLPKPGRTWTSHQLHDYAHLAEVLPNTESTVYVKTTRNVEAIICSCGVCSSSWLDPVSLPARRGWEWERVLRWQRNEQSYFNHVYIGHFSSVALLGNIGWAIGDICEYNRGGGSKVLSMKDDHWRTRVKTLLEEHEQRQEAQRAEREAVPLSPGQSEADRWRATVTSIDRGPQTIDFTEPF